MFSDCGHAADQGPRREVFRVRKPDHERRRRQRRPQRWPRCRRFLLEAALGAVAAVRVEANVHRVPAGIFSQVRKKATL
jgi:hypothetical protein